MALSLPNASAADSGKFNAMFLALPDELKLIVFGHAVRSPYPVSMRNYAAARDTLTAAFAGDSDLLAMAQERFDRLNIFAVCNLNILPLPLDPNVAHLEVNFSIVCEGGNIDNDFLFTSWDSHQLQMACKKIETITIIVRNTGEFESTAMYNSAGLQIPVASSPRAIAFERLYKMIDCISQVRVFRPRAWRNGPKSKRRLLFQQCMPNSSRHVLRMRVPRFLLGAHLIETMYQIHDAPAAMLYFDEGDFW